MPPNLLAMISGVPGSVVGVGERSGDEPGGGTMPILRKREAPIAARGFISEDLNLLTGVGNARSFIPTPMSFPLRGLPQDPL